MEAEDFILDHYMDQLREDEQVQEVIDPVTIGGISLVVGSVYVIGSLISFIVGAAAFKAVIKIDPKLSKEFNKVIKDAKTWNVRVVDDPNPNAFAITGHDVFITSALLKMLNEREVMAVLLHEAFHCKDLHVWKHVATESAFTYLIVFCAISASVAVPFSGFLVAFILKNVLDVAYARMVGRSHEMKADEYAIQYGYGDDLVSSLTKIEKWANKIRGKQVCNKWCQLERKISEAIDEHPPTKKRIEIILRKSKDLQRAASSGFKAVQKFVVGAFKNNG